MTAFFRQGRYTLPLGEKTYVMGIVNVTPDSFPMGESGTTHPRRWNTPWNCRSKGRIFWISVGQSTRPDTNR